MPHTLTDHCAAALDGEVLELTDLHQEETMPDMKLVVQMAEQQPIDTDGTDEPVCPWCGRKYSDGWEFFTGSERDEIEVECDKCGKVFVLRCETDVSYWSEKKGEA
jgi:hypothetical protein